MAGPKNDKLDVQVGAVICYGEEKVMGAVQEIRIIDTAKFVQKFSGDPGDVMLRIRTRLGTALIWPKQHGVFEVSDRDAKEFKSRELP